MAKRPSTEDGDTATPDAEVIDVEVTDISEDERPLRPGPIVWIASAVIVVGIGLLIWARATGPVAEPKGPDPVAVMDQRLADIEQRFAAIDARLAELSEIMSDAAAAGDVAGLASRVDTAADGLAAIEQYLADVEARLDAVADRPEVTSDGTLVFDPSPLEDRLAALEAAPAATGSGPDETTTRAIDEVEVEAQRLAALADDMAARIATLESRPAPTGGAAAAMLAVAQLRAALGGSGTFEAALAAVRATIDGGAPVTAALDALVPHATTGIPTSAMLRARFTGLADDIVRAGYAPPEGSWVARTMARLAKLVTVRRTGDDVIGVTPEAIAARTEARLAAGDLAGAVAEAETLDGAPLAVAADWLDQAQARLAAGRALATLDARAVAALGGAGG
jgi:hypothetical protein